MPINKLGTTIMDSARWHGKLLGQRHWGYFKRTLGQSAGAINQAQSMATAVGYATGHDMSGVKDALGTAANATGQVQTGMATAQNVGKNLQKKDAAGLAISGIQAYGDYRTRKAKKFNIM